MIGLWGNDIYWRQLLIQEGVPFRTGAAGNLTGLKVLVLDRPVDKTAAGLVRKWIEEGGTFLAGAGCAATVVPELVGPRRRLDHILPEASPLFRNIGLIDLRTRGWLLAGRPFPLIHRMGAGHCLILPFEPSSVLSRHTCAPKRFYAENGRFPYEVVSAVSRGEVRRLVVNSLRLLLATQGVPYIHLSYVPALNRGIFGFRIDTDFGPYAQLEATAKIVKNAGLRASWFINTGAHGQFLSFLKPLLDGQDVQLHCHKHVVYKEYQRNLTNFVKGREVMIAAGYQLRGVAAPFGEWNRALDTVFDQLGFLFSSEFCYGYDDLPSRPVTDRGLSRVLQVPVHPICVGRLLRAGADENQIFEYFQDVIELQLARLEPCFLYDHPHRIAQFPELFERLFRYGIERCGGQTTMTEFARWWQLREQVKYAAQAASNLVEITVETPAPDTFITIELEGRFAQMPLQTSRLDLKGVTWRPLPEPVLFGEGLRKLRKATWRLIGHEMIRSLQKKLQPK
ncbi:MAG: hypothetical protein ABIK44_03155 [candidate division WOR-3 bacterium]